jgi:hypothetical protein
MAERVDDGHAFGTATGGHTAADDVRAQAHQLIATANELIRLAKSLEQQSPLSHPAASHPATGAEIDAGPAQIMSLARETYRVRRMRSQIFGDSDLFGEPAWDMLLDLFIATGDGKRVPVTSACIGAAVPTTTALRWLTMLEDRGLVVREHDKLDARRIFVRLTAEAEAKMTAYFTKNFSSHARSGITRMPDGEGEHDEPSAFMLGK